MAKSSNGKYKRVDTNKSQNKPYGTMGYNQQRPLKQGSKGKYQGYNDYQPGKLGK